MSQYQVANTGLSASDIAIICQVFAKYPVIDSAVLFGSRAKSTHKSGSDVDIALKGANVGHLKTIISGELNEETSLPYFFDILDYAQISNQAVIEHIDRVGIVLYEQKP